jgi:DNA-binding transcriptional ArsR family regulator
MSKHLALLRDDGLLVARRQGTQVVYAIEDPSLTELCRLVCDGVRRTASNRHTAVIG